MRKFEESDVLDRYSMKMEKAPLHQRLSAIKNSTTGKVRRCVSEAAPPELAKMFAPRCTNEIRGELNDFETGRIHYFNGDMDRALRYLEEAYNKGQTNAGFLLGKIYLEHLNQPGMALPFFLKSVTSVPKAELCPYIGRIYLEMNNVMKAIEYLEIAFSEGNHAVYEELGELYEQTEQPVKAMEVYEKAFKAGRNDALGHLIAISGSGGDHGERYQAFVSGLTPGERRQFDLEEGHFTYLTGKLTNNPEGAKIGLQRMIDVVAAGADDSWETLFESLIYEGMVDYAIEVCRTLIKKKKKGYSKLAELYLKMNDFDSAEKVCKEGVKAGNSACTYFLGAIKEAGGKFGEAVKHFEKSAQSSDYRAYTNLAIIYDRQGNVLKAKENYEYAFMTPAKRVVASRYLDFLLKNNFIDDAAKVFVEMVEMKVTEKEIYKILFNQEDQVIRRLCNAAVKAGHEEAHIWLAQFYILSKENAKAAEHYRQAAAAGIKEAHVLLAKCLYGQGRFEESKAAFINAFKNKVNCYREFAEVLESEGYFDQAILNYRIAIDMGDSQCYERLIMLLIRFGRPQEAQITMDLAMKKNVPLGYLFKQMGNTPEIHLNGSDVRNIPRNELN